MRNTNVDRITALIALAEAVLNAVGEKRLLHKRRGRKAARRGRRKRAGTQRARANGKAGKVRVPTARVPRDTQPEVQ